MCKSLEALDPNLQSFGVKGQRGKHYIALNDRTRSEMIDTSNFTEHAENVRQLP
jgi:hypothetical protein